MLVLLDLLQKKEVDHLVQLLHKPGPRRDGIVLEIFLTVRQISIPVKLLQVLLVVLRRPETPTPLVVHLAPGGDTVQREHDGLGGLEQVNNRIDVIKDLYPNLLELFGHELRLENDRIVLHGRRDTRTHL